MEIVRIDAENRESVNRFILGHWYTLKMAVRGELVDLGSADGCAAVEDGEITGLVTWRLRAGELEILSLDSTEEHRGVGSALLGEAAREARRLSLGRVTLITTNDNTRALRFYQRRGFDMTGVFLNAVDKARKLKPEIPLTGEDGIPVRHEIELTLTLK